MVHKLDELWLDVECMGSEGDLTKASIDGHSSSHSEKTNYKTTDLPLEFIISLNK